MALGRADVAETCHLRVSGKHGCRLHVGRQGVCVGSEQWAGTGVVGGGWQRSPETRHTNNTSSESVMRAFLTQHVKLS